MCVCVGARAHAGDHFLRPYVISEPEVSVWDRKESDEFVVIASDGLWDVVTNELACKLVKRCLSGKIRRRFSEGTSEGSSMEAASLLTELAMARGSKDNISVIVVQLIGTGAGTGTSTYYQRDQITN